MGLFDNIFLDQNTQTAMLDPLVKPEEKELPKTKPVEDSAASRETQEAASFDALMTPAASSDKKEESASGVNPDHALIDEVSFDIGGIDLPSFDATSTDTSVEASTGGNFLSGGTALSGMPEVSFGDTIDTTLVTTTETTPEVSIAAEVGESSASIALVQSATAVSSDAIVSPIEGVIQIESEEALDNAVTPSVVETNISSTSSVSDATPSESDGIFGLMNTTEIQTQPVEIAVSEAETFVTTEPSVAPSLDTHTSPLFTAPVEQVVTKVDTIPIESISFDDIGPRDTLPEIKTDDVIASIAPAPHLDDSLQDMLQEFVGKLEKFKSENGDVDTEVSEGLRFIQQSRKDLEEEHRVRLLALEYQEKSIREKGEKRIAEQRRLEKIIANLKNEMKK